ncbi:MAG: fibronectin type III domain-containing protein [Bacteroidales bacterium]|nr:fibronectin type III domain-containing protein [Bacteroidales bacterium]
MKSTRILIAALAVGSVLFSGCKKEVFTGIDSSKAAATDFEYDETMSSATSAAFVWNPSAALAAGATSFSVQLAEKDDFSDIDMYDTSKGKTIQADASPNDGVVFTGLKEYDRYYVRVRANYPRSIYSDWTVLKAGDQIACVSVGHGIVAMGFGTPSEINLNSPSYSRIIASWSVVGLADGYAPEWKKSSESSWTSLGEISVAQVEINDLEATTSYDVRVRAFRDKDGSREYTDYVSGTIVTPEKPAFTPDITTAEQFITFVTTIAATAAGSDSYTLENDIDLGGEALPAIEAFAGKFDGKGFTIKNATVSDNLFTTVSGTFSNVTLSGFTMQNGLIGKVTASGKVSGVTLAADCKINFPQPDEAVNYGCLVNENEGTVENCTKAAAVSIKYAALPKASGNWGGIVGYTTGKVTGCKNTGDFAISVDEPASGTFHTFGGVVGKFKGSAGEVLVSECSNTAAVSVEYGTAVYFYTGGVVGGSESAASAPGNYGIIEGCTNEGAVSMHYISGGSGAYPNCGGVVGYTEGQLKGCTNKGDITLLCDSASNTWTCIRLAGVAGVVTRGASDCHNFGKLSLTALGAGGTAGNRGSGNIAASCIAGVIAAAGPYSEDGSGILFENCTNNADLDITYGTITETPNSYFGGVFGYVTAKIDNCVNNNNYKVTSPQSISRLGGIAGGADYDVSNCVNHGKLNVIQQTSIASVNWRCFVGGIVADASKATGSVTYTKCTNNGDLDYTFAGTAAPRAYASAVGGILAAKKSGGNADFVDCANNGKLTYSSTDTVNTADLCAGDYR